MPVYDSEEPPGGTLFGQPQVDVAALYVPTDDYRVLALSQIMRNPPDGRTIPTIDTSFAIPGLPTTHELYIDNYAFTHADPLSYLRGRSKRIRRLYALPEVLPADPEEL